MKYISLTNNVLGRRRGSSYDHNPTHCSSAYLGRVTLMSSAYQTIGFQVVINIKQ